MTSGIVSMDLGAKADEMQRNADHVRYIAGIAHDAERLRQRLIEQHFSERGPEVRHLEELLKLLALYERD